MGLNRPIFVKPGREFFVDGLAMADRYEANCVGFVVDGIYDPKTANPKLPQSVELAQQRVATFRIGGDGADRELNGSFQIRMK